MPWFFRITPLCVEPSGRASASAMRAPSLVSTTIPVKSSNSAWSS
jgi:hypothetical protein